MHILVWPCHCINLTTKKGLVKIGGLKEIMAHAIKHILPERFSWQDRTDDIINPLDTEHNYRSDDRNFFWCRPSSLIQVMVSGAESLPLIEGNEPRTNWQQCPQHVLEAE